MVQILQAAREDLVNINVWRYIHTYWLIPKAIQQNQRAGKDHQEREREEQTLEVSST